MTYEIKPGELESDISESITESVEYFMYQAGQLHPPKFGDSNDPERKVRRAMLLGFNGEISEMDGAEVVNDLVEAVDGIVDSIWVLWGTLITWIGPEAAEEVAQEINLSNLAKIKHEVRWEGEPGKSKILKPVGWEPPNVQEVLERHGWRFSTDGKQVVEEPKDDDSR